MVCAVPGVLVSAVTIHGKQLEGRTELWCWPGCMLLTRWRLSCWAGTAEVSGRGWLIGECAWQQAEEEEQENRKPAPRRVSAK